MEQKVKEKRSFVDNIAYKSKFQFRIWVNENIICQRYFKINGFNEDSIYTAEFTYCMNSIVRSIQEDLESKSRIWLWYTDVSGLLKTHGFVTNSDIEKYGTDFLHLLINDSIVGDIQAPDGKNFYKEYMEFGEKDKTFNTDIVRPSEGEFIFKFSFLIDDITVFEKIWDGNIYPKYVRNGVDLTNTFGNVTDKEISGLAFNNAIVRHMQQGKNNLISDFIRRICDVLSNTFTEKYEYTKNMSEFRTNYIIDKDKYDEAVAYYGVIKPEVTGHSLIPVETKKYNYYSAFENYKRSWKKATSKKTYEYFGTLYENMSQRQLEYIDKRY